MKRLFVLIMLSVLISAPAYAKYNKYGDLVSGTTLRARTSDGVWITEDSGVSGIHIDDDGSTIIASGTKIKLPLDDNATEPTICYDDGTGTCDDGFMLSSNGVIELVINGFSQLHFTSSIMRSEQGSGFAFMNEAASSTNPIYAFRDGLTTGLGRNAAFQPSMIANELEMTRWDGTATAGVSMMVMGGVSVAGGSRPSGLTSFISFGSGASPTGVLANGMAIFGWQKQGWVMTEEGQTTQITPHDPVTGEEYSNSFNVYTGKGMKRYLDSGITVPYTVPKVDWKEAQIAFQKKSFGNSYIQQIIEVPQGIATQFPDIEIDGVGGVTKYKFNLGQKVAYFARNKKTVKGKYKTIRPDHWMDEDGKFWRKRTRDEAILAFVEDTAAIKAKYNKLAPFLKVEIDDPGE